MAEAFLYVNEKWHTGQLRDASYELTTSALHVIGHLIPEVARIDPTLDWFDGTVQVRRAIVPENIPEDVTRDWNRYENSVFQFIASLPHLNSPGRIDSRLAKRLQMFEYFRDPSEARQYLDVEDQVFKRLQTAIDQRTANPVWVTIATYEQSRLLRTAVFEGDYFVRPQPVEN